MTPAALTGLILSAVLTSVISAAGRGQSQDSSWSSDPEPWTPRGRDLLNAPQTLPLQRFPPQGPLPALHSLGPGEEKAAVMPPHKKSKFPLDNNTGPRKSSRLNNALPSHRNAYKLLQDQNLHQSAAIFTNVHTGRATSPEINEFLDQESNRPVRFSLHKPTVPPHNASRMAWMTNRQASSRLYQFEPFRKDFESKERDCVHECHKERDEREAYCNSDFAVNGIIHDVDVVSKGMQLLTILVDSAGLYKMNRLYITPDGFFFRVKVLAVDSSPCPRPCLSFKLGGRYILMGQIYHKRLELPAAAQRAISGRLRAGDGLVTSSGSFVRRFNRKTDRRVLAAAHSKCK